MTTYLRVAILSVVSLFVLSYGANALAKSTSEYQKNYEACIATSSSLSNAAYASCALAITDESERDVVRVFDTLQARLKMHAPDRLDTLMEMHAFWMDYSKRYCRLFSDDQTMWANCQMRLQLMYLDELNRLKDN